jgi:indole-3-glycerol phosphate synthase
LDQGSRIYLYLPKARAHAERTLKEGYYNVQPSESYASVSLKARIEGCRGNPVIAEVKGASPSLGSIRENIDPSGIAHAMEAGGASGISVLTEPKHFRGSLEYLREIRGATELPLLMKDIIVSPEQIKVAARAVISAGADGVIAGSAFAKVYGASIEVPEATLPEIAKLVRELKLGCSDGWKGRTGSSNRDTASF